MTRNGAASFFQAPIRPSSLALGMLLERPLRECAHHARARDPADEPVAVQHRNDAHIRVLEQGGDVGDVRFFRQRRHIVVGDVGD